MDSGPLEPEMVFHWTTATAAALWTVRAGRPPRFPLLADQPRSSSASPFAREKANFQLFSTYRSCYC